MHDAQQETQDVAAKNNRTDEWSHFNIALPFSDLEVKAGVIDDRTGECTKAAQSVAKFFTMYPRIPGVVVVVIVEVVVAEVKLF